MSDLILLIPVLLALGSVYLSLDINSSPKRFIASNIRAISLLSAFGLIFRDILKETTGSSLLGAIVGNIALAGVGVLVGDSLATLWNFVHRKEDPLLSNVTLKDKCSSPLDCKSIIHTKTIPAGAHNNLTQEASRAVPNQRLKVAFGIGNCFVTEDKQVCVDFREDVRKRLHVEEIEWQGFVAAAREIVKHEFKTQENSIDLFKLVQMLTMKMTRRVIWNIDPADHERDDAIRRLAHEVNQQWLRSKGPLKPGQEPDWSFSKQTALRSSLKEAFPDWDGTNSKDNPLNYILPGYETMWRVVLRCFVEVTARGHTDSDEWKHVLDAFLNNPTRKQLDDNTAGFSAALVSKEALRLYPPTRRIYRAFEDLKGKRSTVAADVEKMHHDAAIWGETVSQFDPKRWMKRPKGWKEDNEFMPFGASPFKCLAKQHQNVKVPFGVSMIAVLVAALVETTDGAWVCKGDFPKDGSPLATDREAYKEAVLERVEGA